MRRASRITLSAQEWAQLRHWITDRHTPARVRRRARILLGAAVGRSNREIARTLSLDPATVSFWRRRFAKHRLVGGLLDAPRPGRRRPTTAKVSERILHATYHVTPPQGPRWTTRTLARHLGVNHMQVHRAWKTHGAGPGGISDAAMGFVASSPGRQVELLGVVLQPPRRAVIVGVERTERTGQLEVDGRPFAPRTGISGGFLLASGDSDREELVAILKRMESFVGREGGSGAQWHDLLILLRDLDTRTPPTTQVHVLVENCAEPEAERLRPWFDRHTRFHFHEPLPGSAWLDSLRTLLGQWMPAEADGGAFGGVPLFASAAARFAAGSAPEHRGLVWSSPRTRFGTLSSSGER